MQQDWIWGLIGGGMIGMAGVMFLLINGRILGASGVIGGLVDGSGLANWSERLGFVVGLVVMPMAVVPFYDDVNTHLTSNLFVVIAAGLLVGMGARLANGCTSGHGVCGISRLSLRGIVATITYLLAGAASVLVFKQFLGVI